MKEEFDTILFKYHNQYLSFVDLEKLDDWKKAWNGQDEELFLDILYTHGMDRDYGWKIEYAMHVPRTEKNQRKADYGPMITFKERSDKAFEPYKAVEDVCRDHASSIVRTGMRESLNSGLHLADFIEDELSKHVRYLEMKNEEKKGKE